jgi:hypothetical protein
MSVYAGPNIVENGLILCLDAGNRKSYSGSGTIWRDLSRNDKNASIKNGTLFSAANFGRFTLDGADDFLYVSGFFPVVFNFTVGFWIRINTTANHRGIFCIKNSADSIDYAGGNFAIHTINGGYFGMEAQDLYGGNTSRNNTVINQQISYCSVVCNQTNLQVRYYLNGVLDGIQPMTSTYTFNDHNALFLGCRQFAALGENDYQNPLNGEIYAYQYYNRALTDIEILQNYRALKGRFTLP